MFRIFFIFALFAACCGYAFADGLPSHLSPDPVECFDERGGACASYGSSRAPADARTEAPVWPAPGSDADVQFATNATDSGVRYAGDDNDNIRIVSKVGADLVVENNINLGTRGNDGWGFSGGANLTHGSQAPRGFNIFENQAEMPLMQQRMMEDDGAAVLAMSRSGRARAAEQRSYGSVGGAVANAGSGADMAVEDAEEQEPDAKLQDQVRSWVVASGQTLRDVLQDWCDKEGWDLVWGTSREYPIQASAVFKGRFLDVSSALVRNFSRANPVPYAKFYKGNRVVVVSTVVGE